MTLVAKGHVSSDHTRPPWSRDTGLPPTPSPTCWRLEPWVGEYSWPSLWSGGCTLISTSRFCYFFCFLLWPLSFLTNMIPKHEEVPSIRGGSQGRVGGCVAWRRLQLQIPPLTKGELRNSGLEGMGCGENSGRCPSPLCQKVLKREETSPVLGAEDSQGQRVGPTGAGEGVEAGRPGVEAVVKEARPAAGNLCRWRREDRAWV